MNLLKRLPKSEINKFLSKLKDTKKYKKTNN